MQINNVIAAEVVPNDLPLAALAYDCESLDSSELFRKHHQNLVRFVRRYVRTNEDAEDVVQNTFLEAIRCADRFSGLSKPSTWLFGIALNLARNQVRRNCASMCDAVEDAVLEQFADPGADPFELLEQREIASIVQSVLGNLSEDIRTTFEAVLGEECSYKEAAATLHIPLGTVRSRISRVRTTIRSQVLAGH